MITEQGEILLQPRYSLFLILRQITSVYMMTVIVATIDF